jgi:hypothetical protein
VHSTASTNRVTTALAFVAQVRALFEPIPQHVLECQCSIWANAHTFRHAFQAQVVSSGASLMFHLTGRFLPHLPVDASLSYSHGFRGICFQILVDQISMFVHHHSIQRMACPFPMNGKNLS